MLFVPYYNGASKLSRSSLTLLWRRPLSYKNQSTDLLRKSMDWFLYDNGLRHERVKYWSSNRRFSVKKGVLTNFAKFTGKYLVSVACNFIKKNSDTGVSCGFCEIFNSTYFEEHLWKTASENKHLNMKYIRPVYSVTSFN